MFALLGARGFLVLVFVFVVGRTVLRRLAEVARPAAWPIVVFVAAFAVDWRRA